MIKRMRAIFFLWIPLAVVVGIIIVIFVARSRAADRADRYETVRIKRVTLSQTITATGQVESEKSLSLSFPFSGKIESIFVKEGAEVRAGDLLLQLENTNQEFAVRAAESKLDLSRAHLNLKLSPVSSEIKKVAEEKVKKAEAALKATENFFNLQKKDLEVLTVSFEETVKNASLALESAKASLELRQIDEKNTSLQYTNDLEKAYEDTLTEMKGDFAPIVAALSHMDDILGVRNSEANDSIEVYLYSKDRTLYLSAQSALEKSYQTYEAISGKFSGVSSKNTDQIESLLLSMGSLLDETSSTLSLTREVLNNVVIGGNLSESKLSSLRTVIDMDRTTLTTKIQSLDTRSQTITSEKIDGKALLDSAHGKVVDAEHALELKTQALDQAKIDEERGLLSGKGKVESAEDSLRLAQKDLDLVEAEFAQLVAPPRDVDIASLRAEVENAQVTLEEAKHNLDRTTLRAPFDGAVTDFPRKVGEEVTSQTVVATFLSSSAYLVRANISESDIPFVSLGDDVFLTLDAYGDDVPFLGKIISLASGPTILQDVVYYQIKTTLLHNDKKILPSMTANITISTEKKENVFAIPSRAVQFRNGKNFVRVFRDGTVLEKEMVTGLKGDDGLTEVISGVVEEDDIIFFDREEKQSKF